MTRYLVTGGAGVVGSRFVQTVAEQGHTVRVIDAMETPRTLWMRDQLVAAYGERVTFVRERVERVEYSDFARYLADADCVLHAAAHTGIPHSETDPEDDWVSNVEATRRLLDVMRITARQKPTVLLSSVKPYRVSDRPYLPDGDRTVYQSSDHVRGVNEECVLEPDEPYAASKMAQSALGLAYARTYDLPVTVLRCSNLYGDAPCHGPRHGWLTWFCIAAALGWEVELQGDGRQTRDMLFSDDVASAALACFARPSVVAGQVFNIGGGPPNQVSCREAIDVLWDMGCGFKVTPAPGRKNEDMIFVTNHQRFTHATSWTPKVSVDVGMERIVRWAKMHKKELERIYDR